MFGADQTSTTREEAVCNYRVKLPRPFERYVRLLFHEFCRSLRGVKSGHLFPLCLSSAGDTGSTWQGALLGD